jgi:hypothetical protein
MMEFWYECVPEIPQCISCYIDEEAVLRDLWIQDYILEERSPYNTDWKAPVYLFRRL